MDGWSKFSKPPPDVIQRGAKRRRGIQHRTVVRSPDGTSFVRCRRAHLSKGGQPRKTWKQGNLLNLGVNGGFLGVLGHVCGPESLILWGIFAPFLLIVSQEVV